MDIPTLQKISYIIEENIALRKDCQMFTFKIDQQKQEYDEKIKRRDEHRMKRKQEWAKAYKDLKQENNQLRVGYYWVMGLEFE